VPAVLYALQQLKRRMPAKLVWIGGATPDAEHRLSIARAMRLTGLGEDDVKWTGELSHPEVSRVLRACDMTILPFIDGVSTRRTSAVTALQHGLPLLTTRDEDLESWFVHGKNVYSVAIGDRNGLADGLLQLAQRPELRARLAQGARALYETKFAWEVIAEQVARLADG
jgi:glycosyltransferase involved in cell wall biosynthesis